MNNEIVKTVYEDKIEYTLNGKLHREDGPARIHFDGRMAWWKNGEQHREGGPSLILSDGSMQWWKNNKPHREDGPAVIWNSGSMYWYKNGKRHREDGPAVITEDGIQEYWIDGTQQTRRTTIIEKKDNNFRMQLISMNIAMLFIGFTVLFANIKVNKMYNKLESQNKQIEEMIENTKIMQNEIRKTTESITK